MVVKRAKQTQTAGLKWKAVTKCLESATVALMAAGLVEKMVVLTMKVHLTQTAFLMDFQWNLQPLLPRTQSCPT